MNVSRHKLDVTRYQEYFKEECIRLSTSLQEAARRPSNLGLLAGRALDIVRFGSVASPDSPEIPRALRIAAQALAGIFVIARATGDTVELLLDDNPVRMPARMDESLVEASRWVTGFWLGVICRDATLLQSLCEMPSEKLRPSSTTNPEYRYRLVDALQAFWKGSPETAKLIIAAMEATDPDRPDIHARDWVLNIDVPLIQLLFYLVSSDARFGGALLEALKLHKKYWTATAQRKQDWEGFVSFGLTALAVLAAERHTPCDVESAYVLTHCTRDRFR